MRLPLTHWTLRAAHLPDRLLDDPRPVGLTLPGAAALDAFADLLGEGSAGSPPDSPANPSEDTAPFTLPAMIPKDVPGAVSLCREIDFGALRGDRAVLVLDHIAGRGEILLGDSVVARFDSAQPASASISDAMALTAAPCMLAIDLTAALHLGRRETLTIRFDDVRPAGACGPLFLETTVCAHLAHVTITPDTGRRTMTIRFSVCAQAAGIYVLRAQAVPPGAAQAAAPAREVPLTLNAGETRSAQLSMEVAAQTFTPGKAYAASAIKLLLFFRPADCRRDGVLCDDALLLCGYPTRGPSAFLPLTAEDCIGDCSSLIERLAALRVPAVSLPAPAPDCVYRALCRAGVAVHQFVPEDAPLRLMLTRYPNAALSASPLAGEPLSKEAAAWQLCSTVAFPRAIDGALTPDELLLDAAGRALNPSDEGVQSVLAWLSAVSVRLRAEAARQGRFFGPLCAPDALENPDVSDALRTAFAPLHLSALPLCGAWWTGTRFSATLEAFIPEDERRPLAAVAILEDENGAELARLSAPCSRSGYVGVLEAALPDHPCVLTLACALVLDDEAVEESMLPIYVGERGPLEAAFI